MIQSILEENPEIMINEKNFKGESALIAAVKSVNIETLKTIMKYGKNLDYSNTDDKGNTAIHHAAKLGNLKILELLSPKYVSDNNKPSLFFTEFLKFFKSPLLSDPQRPEEIRDTFSCIFSWVLFQEADDSGIPKKIRRFSGQNSLRNIVLGPKSKTMTQ